MSTAINIFKIIGIVLPLLIAVAFFTVAERRIMASIQRRHGPNEVGTEGLLQSIFDGFKLFVKETTVPSSADTTLFLLAPMISFVLSLIAWIPIPFSEDAVFCDLNLGFLFILAVSSLGVYGILIAGWASNSKYALLGCIRSAAQMISYEVSMGLTGLTVVFCSGSFNLNEITIAQEFWYTIAFFPLCVVFYVTILAETNRHPFDLPEAESELVAGYNVEYSAMAFALFFLSEYGSMLLMSTFASILFLGGWQSFSFPPLAIPDCTFVFSEMIRILQSSSLPPVTPTALPPLPPLSELVPFVLSIYKSLSSLDIPELPELMLSLKILFGCLFFIVSRAILPRFRFDQLMTLGWKCFLPLSLANFVFISAVLLNYSWAPN